MFTFDAVIAVVLLFLVLPTLFKILSLSLSLPLSLVSNKLGFNNSASVVSLRYRCVTGNFNAKVRRYASTARLKWTELR
jgi:hypothetical protein